MHPCKVYGEEGASPQQRYSMFRQAAFGLGVVMRSRCLQVLLALETSYTGVSLNAACSGHQSESAEAQAEVVGLSERE